MSPTRSLIHRSKLSSAATLVVLASCVYVEAQSTSSIEGLITDRNGDIVAGFSTAPVRGGDSFAINTAGNQFLPHVYH